MYKHEQAAVSVIVPVYRGRELFASLLADLRNQTLRDIEIILVDDCGGDGTFGIAEEAAKEDPRIICLHNPGNHGPGYSRNQGIRRAKGEYLAFADADDIIPPDFYSLLYTKARQTSALVVKGRRAAKLPGGSITYSNANDGIKNGLAQAETMLNLFTYEHTTAIYDTALVRETAARNADARQDEDTAFLCMLMGSVPTARFALQGDAVYYYRKVETSLTHNVSASYFEESVKSLQFKLAHLMNLPDSEDVARYAASLFEERCSWRLSRMPEAPGMTEEQKEAYCAAVRNGMLDFYRSGHAPNHVGPGTLLVALQLPPSRILTVLADTQPAFPAPWSTRLFSAALSGKRQLCRMLMCILLVKSVLAYLCHRAMATVCKSHGPACSRHRRNARSLAAAVYNA